MTQFEEFIDLYYTLKEYVRQKDKHLYERWKAGGFLVDPDIMSMYPNLGEVMESLGKPEDEETEDD